MRKISLSQQWSRVGVLLFVLRLEQRPPLVTLLAGAPRRELLLPSLES